jgi:hypothetical protein
MAMRVHMRLYTVPGESMVVAVMFVVHVGVGIVQRLMRVVVLVPLTDMKPDTTCHQGRRHPGGH